MGPQKAAATASTRHLSAPDITCLDLGTDPTTVLCQALRRFTVNVEGEQPIELERLGVRKSVDRDPILGDGQVLQVMGGRF